MAWLSNDLKPDRSQPKGLVLSARLLWTFSAVYRTTSEPLYGDMAARAFEVISNRFWDRTHGGAYWRLTDDWRVMDDSKKIYGQAFCVYALAEYHHAFDNADALARAQELFELLERHAHDNHNGGYWEVRLRDWSEAGPEARLSDKDLNEKKSMNTHLHVLEAFTHLYRVWPERRLADRLRELIRLFEERILDSNTHHLHHYFDDSWGVRSGTYTFGHDIEASWLLCEAADALADEPLAGRIRPLAVRMAAVALAEGVDDEAGAVCYEGEGGKTVDHGKEGWPQAEAVVGFVNAWQLTGDERYLQAAHRIWYYIERHLVDQESGEWFWRINPDGHPDASLPKVSEWKGPYHATRMCLETVRRLRQHSAVAPTPDW